MRINLQDELHVCPGGGVSLVLLAWVLVFLR